jgi:hypothetical protein
MIIIFTDKGVRERRTWRPLVYNVQIYCYVCGYDRDGGSKLLQNVAQQVPGYMVLRPTRQPSPNGYMIAISYKLLIRTCSEIWVSQLEKLDCSILGCDTM